MGRSSKRQRAATLTHAFFSPLPSSTPCLQNIAIVQAGFADHGIPLSLLVVDMDWCVEDG